MWPTSTVMCLTDSLFRLHVSIAQARCGLLPLVSCPVHSGEMCSFNRSSAMWPTSTFAPTHQVCTHKWFQSLKRDVAYFHLACCPWREYELCMFQSLKREVAYFHLKKVPLLRSTNPCLNR